MLGRHRRHTALSEQSLNSAVQGIGEKGDEAVVAATQHSVENWQNVEFICWILDY